MAHEESMSGFGARRKPRSFKLHLNSVEELKDLRLNIAVDDDGRSFWVLKIKYAIRLLLMELTTHRLICRIKGQVC